MSATISGTLTSTYVLSNRTAQNPATVAATGVIDVNGTGTAATAIYGLPVFGWTVVNLGTVEAAGSQGVGITLDGPGLVVNGAPSAATGGYIEGSEFAVSLQGFGSGIVVNYGTIESPSQAINFLGESGTVSNGGVIVGSVDGISVNSFAGAYVSNVGTILATARYGVALDSPGGATVANSGTIEAVGAAGIAIDLPDDGGVIVNGASGRTSALIEANSDAIQFTPSARSAPNTLTLINYGTIASSGTNAFNGWAVFTGATAVSTITNFGTIVSADAGSSGGVLLTGGRLTNEAGALIAAAGGDGIFDSYAPATVNNFGIVVGGPKGVGIALAAGSTLINAGTIAAPGGAVTFASDAGNRLIVAPGAFFGGTVSGAGGTLELAPGGGGATGTLTNVGSEITGFASLQFDAGAEWTISGSAAELPATIIGFVGGDTIDALGLVANSSTYSDGELGLENNGTVVAQATLSTPYAKPLFTLTPDGSGGTDVTVASSGSPQAFAVTDPLMTNTAGALVFDRVVGGQMAYTQIALSANSEFDGAASNFLGDGAAGFLIRDPSTGALHFVEDIVGATPFAVGALGQEWQFSGNADFLGTGQSEFLIRNTGSAETGALDLGQASNFTVSYTQVGGLGLEWEFDGTGDFLGDGKNGFLIRNTGNAEPGALDVGEIVNGAAQYTPIGGVGTEWKFEGTGDFLGDGNTGFLIWNSGSAELGAMAIGEVINGSLQFTDIGAVGPEWQFVGTGNYVDSNKTDFLIRNTGNGALVVGSVSGSTGSGSVSFTTVGAVGPEWTFQNTNPALMA